VRNYQKAHLTNQAGVRTGCKKAVAVALILSFITLSVLPAGWAQGAAQSMGGDREQSSGTDVGLEAASWALTVPYGAVKVAFAILGGFAGGLTYVFSGGNTEAAKAVWDTSVRGTYVITPAHLKGDKPVRFLGVQPEEETASSAPAR
jgi:hypothetical protein